ncbi:uncharacterized [Tachysurus ichikawai]
MSELCSNSLSWVGCCVCTHVGLVCGFTPSQPMTAQLAATLDSDWTAKVKPVIQEGLLSINTTRGQALTNACAFRSSARE